jgi:hypothetical protein
LNGKNAEGYLDPTAATAIKNVSDFGFRPLVYICSPYSGDVAENTEKARRYSRFAVDKGAIPIAPHLLLPQYMHEETERDLAMFMDMVILSKCAELWVFGSRISAGMQAEIDRAKRKNIPVRYFTEDL